MKRVVQLGISSGFKSKLINNGFATTSLVSKSDNTCRRNISQLVNPNGKRVCLVDTLALVYYIPNS